MFGHISSKKWPAQLLTAAIFWWVASHWLASAQTSTEMYRQELMKLDGARPESVCVARDRLRELMPAASADGRDAMFREFRLFYLRSVSETGAAFLAAMNKYADEYEQWTTKIGSRGSMQTFLKERPDIATAGARWFHCGFLMSDGEGELYPAQDPDFLATFSDELGPDLASYVRFRSAEDRENIMDDQALQISWEQLRMRLERWETFGREHPKLPETKTEVEREIRALAQVYFFGSDNTPTYDYKDGRVEEGLLSSWSEFADRDGSSRYHALISSLLKDVREQDHKITQTDRPLFERAGLGQEFDQWWRWYQQRMTGR